MKKTMAYLCGSLFLVGAFTIQMPAMSQSSKVFNPLDQGIVTPVDNAALDFTLVNKTGYEIAAIYLSPSNKDTWGENILEDVCPDGSTVSITFNPEADHPLWDMKIEWSDEDSSVVWKELNLTKINKLTLYYDEESGKTTAKAE